MVGQVDIKGTVEYTSWSQRRSEGIWLQQDDELVVVDVDWLQQDDELVGVGVDWLQQDDELAVVDVGR